MKFKILTLFPEMFPGPLSYSISGKALLKKIFTIETVNIRDFSNNQSKRVDDTPYGGGAGMILKPDIMQRALDSAEVGVGKKVIFLSPSGKKLDSGIINNLIKLDEIIIICGRYEGIDHRFLKNNNVEEISIGDYVLSGGEIASIILIDTCVRQLPEVLGNKNSLKSESFQNHLLEYPQFTKPRDWMGMKVPDVLLNGNHSEILNWRLKESIKKTKKIRPDLFEIYAKTTKEKK
tara:strand:- start:188 stop:889 length:702 start_codon:yes stop_codon:yes gene_type:complete